jgi:cytochrome c peroxidase
VRCVCYLKLLREVVHFYNTLDALPRCQIGDPGEKVLAGRRPSVQRQMNRRQLGNPRLTGKQESQIVAFPKTLTDGYTPPTE